MLLLQVSQSIATAACCLQEHEDEFGMTLCARGQALKVGETMSSVVWEQPTSHSTGWLCELAMGQCSNKLGLS